MPCIYTQEGEGIQLALWKITETADFFNQKISYRSPASNPEVKTQQLASRFLLNELSPDFSFDDVVLNNSGKPVFPDQEKHFSLSHTKGYAAAIINEHKPVGIDIELISDRVLRVEHKFLNEHERGLLSRFDSEARVKYATLCWSIKETVFKCWGEGGVDFSSHINIVDITDADQGSSEVQFMKNGFHHQVNYMLFGDLWLTYTVDLSQR